MKLGHRISGTFAGHLALFMLLFIAGCGGKPTGTVSGKVTFRSEPVAMGTIAFLATDGTVCSAMIRDGRYAVSKVPVGPVTLTVSAHAPPPTVSPDGRGPDRMPKSIPIPERYADHKNSGLTFDVVSGSQVYDVDLQP